MSLTMLVPRGASKTTSLSRSALRERRSRVRRWSLAAAGLTALALVSALVWAITWFRPEQPAALVLLGAGYEENLAVPHNVYGWQSLIDLAEHGDDFPRWEQDLLRVAHPPRVLRTGASWAELIESPRAGHIVIFISAHGAADQDGAFLLPHDSTGAASERLRITSLLDRIAQLPPHAHKLLVLDATQIEGDWRLGFLHNEFARALTELEPQIRAIPHLSVLCASDVDQPSAVCDQWRRTVFAHYFLAALRGDGRDADSDGRLSVDELQHTIDAQLAAWSQTHHGVAQQTLLLPRGAEGERRARRIELAVIDRDDEPVVAAMVDSFTPSAELQSAWESYAVALEALPQALAENPALWRQYEATLLRHEELIRAGDNAHAAALCAQLTALRNRLAEAALPPPASLENSLAICSLAGRDELPQAAASELLGALWDAPASEQAKVWSAAVADERDGPATQRLRIAVYAQLVQRASENPSANLRRAAQMAALIASPLRPLPAEVHCMTMLDRYLPDDALRDDGGARVGRAIALKCLAERAAVAHLGEASPLSAEVAPWIAADVVAADAERRLGEDLLFASSADRAQADAYFTTAEETYRRALHRAQLVQQAMLTRNRVLAQLPYYGQWLVAQSLAASDADHERALDDLERLWRSAHDLDATLAACDAATIDRAPLPTVEQPQPQSLIEREHAVAAQFAALVEQYHTFVTAIATGAAAADWHEAQPALRVPHHDWRTRMKVISSQHDTMRQLLARDGDEAEANIDRLVAPPAMDEQARAKRLAYGQGRIALATLGRAYFAESQTTTRESFDQTRHRLDVFPVEAAWWKSTLAAGEQIHNRYSELPTRIDAAIKQLPDATATQGESLLVAAQRLSRQIDGSQAERLAASPSLATQRVRLSDLLSSLAERTLLDGWHDLDPQAEPYFRRVGLLYLSDAQQLAPRSPRASALRDALINRKPLQLVPPAKLDVTTQRRLQLSFTFASGPSALRSPERSGLPVAWLTCGEGLQLVSPMAGERIVRRLDGATTAGEIPFAIDSPRIDTAEQNPPSGPRTAASELTLSGFFRGQVLTAKIPVTLHLRPEITVEQPPLPSAAAVSLAAPASVHAQFGDGSGTVAIVLDASGSMGPPRGSSQATSKYAEATAALREVLAQLPAGTTVSLWMFGQATGGGRAASPESTIRQVQTPVAWQPHDPSQLAGLMAKIDPATITPWNESPLVRTIFAAKADLDGAAGFKTIVVITDGIDNRFAQDRVANPHQRSVSETLAAEFEGSGIALSIVGFKVDSAEQQHAREQFEIVEKLFPPGRFYRVSQADELAHTLRLALRQRLRFTLDGYDNEPAVAPLELGNLDASDVWPASPLVPGSYRLQTNLGRPISAEVSLARGDVLALALEPTADGFAARRRSYGASHYAARPTAEASGWRATLLQNQLAPGRELRTAIALEQPRDDGAARLSQITPRIVWFDLTPPTSAAGDTSIAWQRMLGWPMPVWNVRATNWPLSVDGRSTASPRLRAWWNSDAALPLVASVSRGPDRPTVADLTGVVLQGADETVRIASIACEEHVVAQRDGRRSSQPCLVVRLEHTAGKIYWAELAGMQTAGAEQRFYPSVGETTCLFWPANGDEVERSLAGIGIVSLDALQRDAERCGMSLELGNLPPPDANDILPTPAYSLE